MTAEQVQRDVCPAAVPADLGGPSGASLLALALAEEARGIRGLDLLRRSVDRAPPAFC